MYSRPTALPVTVLNSHTHFNHVGGNAEFTEILNVDSNAQCPVAEPRNLTRLLDAFNDVQNGRITPVVTDDGYREYHFEGFSLLFAANVKK